MNDKERQGCHRLEETTRQLTTVDWILEQKKHIGRNAAEIQKRSRI